MHQQGRRQRGSQAVWLVQLARPFSALTAGLRTRVLLRHCVLVRPVTQVVLTTICAAMLVRLARLWCAHQILMSLTAWRQTRSVSELPAMNRLATWIPAAMLVQRARSCLVLLAGPPIQMPQLLCALDRLVTRAREIWRHAAWKTLVLRFRSPAGLPQTIQLAIRALLDWC